MKKILNALFLFCICAALLLALGYVVLQAAAASIFWRIPG